jgi:hypothetical protein
MKNVMFLVTVVIISVFIQSTTSAAEFPKVKSANSAIIEQNLLNGITSECSGLRLSAAYYLGEMESSKAVIPLLEMLHKCKCEQSRILAALSLIKIGDRRGVFAVQQSAIFDDSPRVRRMCQTFYLSYLQEHNS